jgi:hypothetical protein
VNAESHSSSPLLVELLLGPVRKGTALTRRDLRFGDYVVTLTATGGARMPNGVECAMTAAPDARVSIGRGRIAIGHVELSPGPGWNPVPALSGLSSLPPGPQPMASSMVNWVTTPSTGADPLLAGYVAGLVLLHGQRKRAQIIAHRAAANTDPLHATLLRHAARGEVFEPIHKLLITGDPGPLLAHGARGMLWLRGLVSAGFQFEASTKPLPTGRRTLASQRR